MDALLSRFRHFVERRGQETFKVTPMPQEAGKLIHVYLVRLAV